VIFGHLSFFVLHEYCRIIIMFADLYRKTGGPAQITNSKDGDSPSIYTITPLGVMGGFGTGIHRDLPRDFPRDAQGFGRDRHRDGVGTGETDVRMA
jgi:hypothetical protein